MFDRLLKACGQVIWKDDTTSILVLNQIQVNAPYGPENCEIIIGGGGGMSNGVATATTKSGSGTATSSSGSSSGNSVLLEDGSLERVRKIVAAVNADLAEANNMEQSG